MDYFNQESERLTYRRLTQDDIPNWTEFFIDNDRLKYFGFDLSKGREELAGDWINLNLDRYRNDNVGHLAVLRKSDNAFIGLCGLLKREFEDEVLYEVAYSLIPKYWGNGYATEMAKKIKQFGMENMGLKKVISIIHVDNKPSMNVALKNGLLPIKEGEFKGMPVVIFGN